MVIEHFPTTAKLRAITDHDQDKKQELNKCIPQIYQMLCNMHRHMLHTNIAIVSWCNWRLCKCRVLAQIVQEHSTICVNAPV